MAEAPGQSFIIGAHRRCLSAIMAEPAAHMAPAKELKCSAAAAQIRIVVVDRSGSHPTAVTFAAREAAGLGFHRQSAVSQPLAIFLGSYFSSFGS